MSTQQLVGKEDEAEIVPPPPGHGTVEEASGLHIEGLKKLNKRGCPREFK